MHEAPTRHLVFEILEDLRLVVSCQSSQPPTDTEWHAWLAAARALGETVGEFRLLVITEGGRPTREQQRRLAEAKHRGELERGKQNSEPRTAIVSSAAAERFWVSVLLFMNPAIRCFAPSQLQRAYAHLGLTASERAVADAKIARLRAKLAAPLPLAGG